MSYTLKSITVEKAKSTGNPYGRAVLEDGRKVAIFFPNVHELKPGDVIDGDLTVGEYQGAPSYSIFPFKKSSTFVPKGQKQAPRAQEIAKTMEVKAQHIETAQMRKDESVKIAGTARDATLLTVAMFQKIEVTENESIEELTEQVKTLWQKWRTWLMTEFDQLPPF